MAKKTIWLGMATMMLAFVMVFIGCDDGNGSGGNFVPVTDITNLPQIAIKDVELDLVGTVVPEGATNKTIIWSGQGVANGKFKGTTTGDYAVTATIANGVSESSPYTKNFIITVFAVDNTEAEVGKSHGVWTKATSHPQMPGGVDTFTINKNDYTWSIRNSAINMVYSTGIIIFADGTNFRAQQNFELGWDGYLYPSYYYATGTYSFSESNTKFTLTSPDPYGFVTGTWTKQ